MQTTAAIIGAGHAGLAMSRRLTERSIDHIVLERGEVAHSWRTQRWPSLRLLTPNWQTRLPGHDYAGDDPDGYLPAASVAATLTGYADLIGAPVRTSTTVHTLRTVSQGFEIGANDDLLRARAVVLATGACSRPAIPGIADAVPESTRRDVPAGRMGFVRTRTRPAAPATAGPAPGPGHSGHATCDVILAGCVKTKAPEASPGCDLYLSPLFERRRRYAESSGRPWYILSAEHGLLDPGSIIEPYDVHLTTGQGLHDDRVPAGRCDLHRDLALPDQEEPVRRLAFADQQGSFAEPDIGGAAHQQGQVAGI